MKLEHFLIYCGNEDSVTTVSQRSSCDGGTNIGDTVHFIRLSSKYTGRICAIYILIMAVSSPAVLSS